MEKYTKLSIKLSYLTNRSSQPTLPARITIPLRKQGLETIGDIVKLTKDQLARYKNIGLDALWKIDDLLDYLRLTLAPEILELHGEPPLETEHVCRHQVLLPIEEPEDITEPPIKKTDEVLAASLINFATVLFEEVLLSALPELIKTIRTTIGKGNNDT